MSQGAMEQHRRDMVAMQAASGHDTREKQQQQHQQQQQQQPHLAP